MMQTMADGTDPSNFQVYATDVLLVCICCDTNLIRVEDPLLLDLTDAARTHVCDPRKVAAVEALNQRHEERTKK